MRSVDTIIVSDVHLGSRMSQAKRLLDTLKNHDFKRLILNGDIGDSPRINRLNQIQWEFLKYITQLKQKGIEVAWVAGNHDPHWTAIAQLVGADTYQEYSWTDHDIKYLAIHGHQFDKMMKRKVLVGGVAWVFDKIQLVAPRRRITRFFKNGMRVRASKKVAKAALAYGQAKGANVVICGHTHKPLAILNGPAGVKYFNSGSWTNNVCSYIVIDQNGPELVQSKEVKTKK